MKVLILGAKGMLGTDLSKVFADEQPYLLDKEELDITQREEISACFFRLKPDVVINAAAYTDVDGCETNKELAMKVNGEAPGYLAAAAKDAGAIFVHYSTDYVFDGKKSEGYSEKDEPASPKLPLRPRSEASQRGEPGNPASPSQGEPLNFYGESKLAGERAVQAAGGNYYIIRTSWLFGLHGKNFVETMLRLAKEKKDLRVVNDQHGKPTFSLDLARSTRKLLEAKKDFGMYHIVNEPATTWYDFARAIIKTKGGLTPLCFPCGSEEFPRPARRPEYSILLNTKLPPMRSWQEALEEYLRERN